MLKGRSIESPKICFGFSVVGFNEREVARDLLNIATESHMPATVPHEGVPMEAEEGEDIETIVKRWEKTGHVYRNPIEISAERLGEEPWILTYMLEVHGLDGETYLKRCGSEDQLKAFIEGARAYASCHGHYFSPPEVPREQMLIQS